MKRHDNYEGEKSKPGREICPRGTGDYHVDLFIRTQETSRAVWWQLVGQDTDETMGAVFMLSSCSHCLLCFHITLD